MFFCVTQNKNTENPYQKKLMWLRTHKWVCKFRFAEICIRHKQPPAPLALAHECKQFIFFLSLCAWETLEQWIRWNAKRYTYNIVVVGLLNKWSLKMWSSSCMLYMGFHQFYFVLCHLFILVYRMCVYPYIFGLSSNYRWNVFFVVWF